MSRHRRRYYPGLTPEEVSEIVEESIRPAWSSVQDIRNKHSPGSDVFWLCDKAREALNAVAFRLTGQNLHREYQPFHQPPYRGEG
jgi:hypothetical protein